MDVRKVARLARLDLSDDELSSLESQIARILKHIDQLKALDTGDVKPFVSPGGGKNVVRDDEGRPSLPRERALGNAPEKSGDSFTVPPVMEE